ncbi:ClpP-like prohead protease/major capsid protein fusion protein [Rhizobacter sp. SG703]|uniref:ClpP-like prohead protease/major capsid protein fusion protein n=1 Tax=Rhizobacter sp. SG703 TaxID=2587140 RepID=UPI0014457C3F|nr:ClpP-like prohead protease/major capsid protein fusion protein [Rhizobacter sp. SG703]NKI97548.1 ATP-dependent protease ClpP protease subunit [Rhizobacter sp. SG703]
MSTIPWYSIHRRPAISARAAAEVQHAEIWIYGDIGESWYGDSIAAKDFVQTVAALDAETITVRLNSYGGSVSDGIAIYNALKRHPATITVSVDGIAASIASLIAMAGDRIEIAENAMLMIHAPWGSMAGNAVELREYADMLDKWSQAMAASYASKTGRSLDEVMAWLTDGKDHWFTAGQAVDEKLADATTAALPISASASRFTWAAARGASVPAPSAVRPAAHTPSISSSQETALPTSTVPTQTTTPMPTDAVAQQEAVQAAVRAENQRQSSIRAAFQPYMNDTDAPTVLNAALADMNCTVVQAKARLLDAMARGAEPVTGGYLVTVEDETDKRRAGMAAALEIRAGLVKNDGSNPWRGHSLVEMARACLQANGVKHAGTDRMSLIALAFTHGSGDFPLLLANIAQKAMLKGYDEAEETFQLWTTKGTLPDFKPMQMVDIGSFPALRQVAEGGEYKYITIGERAETRVLATYGDIFKITRQAVINDDLDAFTRIPRKMGRAAVRTVGNLAYAVLTGNAPMADGKALFHADHGNVAEGTAITTAAVDAMRVAMARQKDIGQTSGSLNIRMAKLLVPISLQGTANVVRDSEFEVGAGTKNNTVPNSVRGTFEVIADARLDDNSTSKWYGVADQSMHDVVTVDYLDGNEAPTMEQQQGWNVDGVEFKVRLDASAKALDWKTMQRNG